MSKRCIQCEYISVRMRCQNALSKHYARLVPAAYSCPQFSDFQKARAARRVGDQQSKSPAGCEPAGLE